LYFVKLDLVVHLHNKCKRKEKREKNKRKEKGKGIYCAGVHPGGTTWTYRLDSDTDKMVTIQDTQHNCSMLASNWRAVR